MNSWGSTGQRGRVTRVGAVLCAALVALTACGGTSSVDVSVPEVEFGPASNADGILRPTPDGFSFANFTSADVAAETFGGGDLAAMFGSGPEVCSSGIDDSCVPTAEALEWAAMVNDMRESGHCEGFIVAALQRFADKSTPSSANLKATTSVVHGIFRGFASQFIMNAREEARAWRRKDVRSVVAELADSLKDGVPDHVLGLYGEYGGHAVLPYSVTFTDTKTASIGIYDSNWPGQERRVSVDLAAGTWRFSFDGPDPESDESAWTGGKGSLDLSSLDSRASGTCPFCDSKTSATLPTMLTIRAASSGWKLKTPRGEASPSTPAAEGIDVSKVRAVLEKKNLWVVTLDSDVLSEGPAALTLPKGATAHIVTPRAVGRAATSGAAADFELTPESITTKSSSASLVLANGDSTVTSKNKPATLSLSAQGTPVLRAVPSGSSPVNQSTTSVTTARTSVPATSVAASTTTQPENTATSASPTSVTAAPSTTTTNPVGFTHSFRDGGAVGYASTCSSEILDITVTGATGVSSVTGTVGGTAMPGAMNSGGNDWTFYSMPSKSPGTYTVTVTVTAANGTRTKNLSITYDNDCIQGN